MNGHERSSAIDRRRFLGSAAAAVFVGGIPVGSAAVAQGPATAMQLVTILNGAMSTMRSFAGSGGGLEAMLQAQNAKLDLIVDQLTKVQQEISELRIDVARLPTMFQGFLRSSRRDNLLDQISGAARLFVEANGSNIYESGYTGSERGQREIESIQNQASLSRTTLGSMIEGRGPEAAMIAPMAMALEVAAQGMLGSGRGRTLSTLDSYQRWFALMRSGEMGSVWSTMSNAVVQHDLVIDKMAQTPAGAAVRIVQRKMGHAEAIVRANYRDPCSLLCGATLDLPSPNHFTHERQTAGVARYCLGWGAEREIGEVDEQVLGIKLLTYDVNWERVIGPKLGDVCTWLRNTPWTPNMHADFEAGRLTKEMIRQRTAHLHGALDSSRASFLADLEIVNLWRVRAGQAALALQIIDQTEKQAQLYRTLYA